MIIDTKNFKPRTLGISGTSLVLFYIINSFTVGREGMCFGSVEYLAEQCGVTERSIRRVLSCLVSDGIIEKCKRSGRYGYRVTEYARSAFGADAERNGDTSRSVAEPLYEPTDANAPSNDAELDLPPSELTDELGIDVTGILLREVGRPTYDFRFVGDGGIVKMTAEQQKRLLKLVGPEMFRGYVKKLERLIRDKGYRTYNCYETIKKWAYEDARV